MATTWTMPRAAPQVRDYGIDAARMESRRVSMTPLEPHDLSRVIELLMDPARTVLFFQEPMTEARVRQWVSERACWVFGGHEGFIAMAVGEFDQHRNMTLHAISVPGTPTGLVLEACRLGVAVAFERLGARRLVATPIEGNDAVLKLVRHLGFRHEGTLRKAIHIAGRYRDIHMYALLKED